MKKLTLFAAASLTLALIASCVPQNDDPQIPEEPEKPEVQTAKDNLVLHFSFEADEAPGTGVAFVGSSPVAAL